MAINGVQWKGSILDTYKDNKKFGGEYVGFDNAKAAGGAAPVTTDFIKGITPQERPVKYKGDASSGFTANLTPGDKNFSLFNMINEGGQTTNADFDPLDINNDYKYNGANITGFNSVKRYKKPTNP